MGRLSAFILGAAAGGGFPQWNCNCDVCKLAWAGDPRVTVPGKTAHGTPAIPLRKAAPRRRPEHDRLQARHGAAYGRPVLAIRTRPAGSR